MKTPLTALARLVIAMTACMATRVAPAQPCAGWTPGNSLPGLDGRVLALTQWDPDGAGPKPAMLIAGGQFTVAGDALASNIAAWDGVAWSALGGAGAGMDGQDSVVSALAVFNGELIVGGQFQAAGGIDANNIARWNGSTWQTFGSGFSGATPLIATPQVYALTIHNYELIAGGAFTTADGVTANSIARWDGSAWRALGTGVRVVNGAGFVRSLATYQGELVAGGAFTTAGGVTARCVARWNGAAWQNLGSGINTSGLSALCVFNGELVAGGKFTTAGGVPANNIARWNGAVWTNLGSGVDDFVFSLTLFDGALIAGGGFSSAGGASANRVARWDGAAWGAFSSGMSEYGSYAACLAIFHDQIVAGGEFLLAGGVGVRHIASWTGSAWLPLGAGLNDQVSALAVYHDELIAGGWFDAPEAGAGRGVARWTGDAWEPLGLGVPSVSALAVFNDELIVGETFAMAGNVPANSIAAWNGASWRALGAGLSGLSGPGQVFALAVYNGELIAGGRFVSSGGVAVSNIARWNGESWQPLGLGVTGPPGSFAAVGSLAVYDGALFAAGNFTTAGSVEASNFARWDGTTWTPFGSIPKGSHPVIYALGEFEGDLVVGGTFDSMGGIPATNIARWNGSTWDTFGSGLSGPPLDPYARVFLVRAYNGQLFAGGTFASQGAPERDDVARWDGVAWRPCSAGVGPPIMPNSILTDVNAMQVFGGALVVGGSFITAGGQPSAFLARWRNAPGDATNDDRCDFLDLNAVLSAYGQHAEPGSLVGDVNNDGVCDFLDLNAVLGAFGSACP